MAATYSVFVTIILAVTLILKRPRGHAVYSSIYLYIPPQLCDDVSFRSCRVCVCDLFLFLHALLGHTVLNLGMSEEGVLVFGG